MYENHIYQPLKVIICTHTHTLHSKWNGMECGGQMVKNWIMLVEHSIVDISETEEVKLHDGYGDREFT